MAYRDDRRSELLAAVTRARNFSGWGPFPVSVRTTVPLPWSYEAEVAEAARGARSALDLGTGGGEKLTEMAPSLPGRTVATEEWVVNAPIAHKRLRPLGIPVLRACATRGYLPFRGASFDLVIDRHEAFDPMEVERVLIPGGRFVTQQMGPDLWRELTPSFPRKTDFHGELESYPAKFEVLGMAPTLRKHERPIIYKSLAEFVVMLCIAPWSVPDFDIETDLDALLDLERLCLTNEGLILTEEHWLITATKPSERR